MHVSWASRPYRKRSYKQDRLEYLDQLVTEFQDARSLDTKRQVLANLANFAYDPYNFSYFRQLNILDLFLDHLEDTDIILIKFAAAGLCNSCLDPLNKEYILRNDGVKQIGKLLQSSDEYTRIYAITMLMYLVTPQSKSVITQPQIIKQMITFKTKGTKREKNLASVFVQNYCSQEKAKETENICFMQGVNQSC